MRVNLFRIHIRPRGGTNDMDATFAYCVNQELLGVGWRVDGLANTEDWKVYKQAATQLYRSIQQPCYINRNVDLGDLVWTRDPRAHYYLARVTSRWRYWTCPEGEANDIDIANIFRCNFYHVLLDEVPGKVISNFGAPGQSIR